MTLLTIAAVFAITSLFQQFVTPHLASWPLELRLRCRRPWSCCSWATWSCPR